MFCVLTGGGGRATQALNLLFTLSGVNFPSRPPYPERRLCRHTAVKSGINLIDTAPWYGHGKAEEVLGKALKGTVNNWVDNWVDNWVSNSGLRRAVAFDAGRGKREEGGEGKAVPHSHSDLVADTIQYQFLNYGLTGSYPLPTSRGPFGGHFFSFLFFVWHVLQASRARHTISTPRSDGTSRSRSGRSTSPRRG